MSPPDTIDRRRRLPAVDRLLSHPAVQRLVELYGRELVRVQARQVLEEERRGSRDPAPFEELLERLGTRAAAAVGPPLRRVINATGVLLHTNLGRAPLPRRGRPRPAGAARRRLRPGARPRHRRSAASATFAPNGLLALLTGAPAALVANNNAAALVLALASLAAGREVVVSRGELVEIGGSFRIPDILRRVGRPAGRGGHDQSHPAGDYRRALGAETALLLKVHASNYRIVGFTESVAAAALGGARLASAACRCWSTKGPGCSPPDPSHSSPITPACASCSPPARTSSPAAATSCSADRRRGCSSARASWSSAAGVIPSTARCVRTARRSPPSTSCCGDTWPAPSCRSIGLWPDPQRHRLRLERIAAAVGAEVVPAEAFVGGGAAPERPIPGEALALTGSDALLARLRGGVPPVVGYLRQGRLVLDLRTVDPEDDEALVAAVRSALAATMGSVRATCPRRGEGP